MISYARDLALFQPGRTALLFVLLICGAATEGISLVLLVPLVELAGVGNGSELGTRIAEFAAMAGWSPSLRGVILVFLAAIIARSLVVYGIAEISASLTYAYLHHVRSRLFAAISDARWPALLQQSRPHLHQALSNAPYQLAHGLNVCVRVLSSATFVAIGCGLALAAEPMLSGIVLFCALILAIPMFVFNRMTHQAAQAEYEKVGELYGRIGAHLNNLKMSRFLGNSAQAAGRHGNGFDQASEQDAELLQRVARIHATASLTHQIGAALLLAVAIGLVAGTGSVFGIAAGAGLHTSHFILLIVIFARLVPQAQTLFGNTRQLVEISAPYSIFKQLLSDLGAAAEPDRKRSISFSALPEIRLEDVSFAYQPGRAVLDNVSLVLPAGQTCAIIGPSGAGKTTLADLVCGLLQPISGRIMINAELLEEPDFSKWRNHIGLVTQDEFLWPGSVRDNIDPTGGREDAEIWAALETSGFAGRLRQEPEQLDLQVGERGERISRGERQRICLARALLRRPRLLVLDEATSALNPIDETGILHRLSVNAGQMTVLVIAHRFSSLANADRIFVLQKGHLTESGTLSDLLDRPGSFVSRMGEASSPPVGISNEFTSPGFAGDGEKHQPGVQVN